MAKQKIYYIPENFIESGGIFHGKFKTRNFIEAVVVTAPMVGVFYLAYRFLDLPVSSVLYPGILCCAGIFSLGLIGYDGESWGQLLVQVKKFRTNPYNIAVYNPRIKTELNADYLDGAEKNGRAEAIKNFVAKLNEALAGNADSSAINEDLTSGKTIMWFKDDAGIVEKPSQIKTPAELKAEAKEAKAVARKKKQEQKEYLASLGPRQRRMEKARFKAEAKAQALAEKEQREKELQYYQNMVEQQEKEAAEKKKIKVEAAQQQKNKAQAEKRTEKQIRRDRKKHIKQMAKENAIKEKQAYQGLVDIAKQDINEQGTIDHSIVSRHQQEKTKGGFVLHLFGNHRNKKEEVSPKEGSVRVLPIPESTEETQKPENDLLDTVAPASEETIESSSDQSLANTETVPEEVEQDIQSGISDGIDESEIDDDSEEFEQVLQPATEISLDDPQDPLIEAESAGEAEPELPAPQSEIFAHEESVAEDSFAEKTESEDKNSSMTEPPTNDFPHHESDDSGLLHISGNITNLEDLLDEASEADLNEPHQQAAEHHALSHTDIKDLHNFVQPFTKDGSTDQWNNGSSQSQKDLPEDTSSGIDWDEDQPLYRDFTYRTYELTDDDDTDLS